MKKSLAVQCHNCQRYHHTTNQCHFRYRCVQCTIAHNFGDCPRANNKALPIGCINCSDAGLDHIGHTANDLKNCGFYKKATETVNPSHNGRPQRNNPTTTSNPNVSVKPINATSSFRRGAAGSVPMSYASALRAPSGGLGNISADQLSQIIAATVQSVLKSISNGA